MGLGNPSLGGGHILRQILKGDLLDPQFTLPPLSDIATQPVGSNACGCYIIHYMEQELKLFRGEWPSVWPEVGWKNWKLRLVTVVPKLQVHSLTPDGWHTLPLSAEAATSWLRNLIQSGDYFQEDRLPCIGTHSGC